MRCLVAFSIQLLSIFTRPSVTIFLVRCSCFFRGGGLLVEVVLDISKSLPVMREVSPMGISQRNRLATMQRLHVGGGAVLKHSEKPLHQGGIHGWMWWLLTGEGIEKGRRNTVKRAIIITR